VLFIALLSLHHSVFAMFGKQMLLFVVISPSIVVVADGTHDFLCICAQR